MAMGKQPATEQSHVAILCDQLVQVLQVIGDGIAVSRDALPAVVLKTLESQLAECHALIASVHAGRGDQRAAVGRGVCSLLHEVQQVLQANEEPLMRQRLTVEIQAGKGLPQICATPEQMRLVVGELLAYAIQIGAQGSRLALTLREAPLRRGSGVEWSLTVAAPAFSERDRYRLFEEFVAAPRDAGNGTTTEQIRSFAFALCRRVIEANHGQWWVDLPAKGKVSLAFVIPCVRDAGDRTAPRVKCDVIIRDYPALQELYGTTKTAQLLRQVEAVVCRCVRRPLDAVAAFEPRGIVSAILDIPPAQAAVVVDRLRRTLAEEAFTINRRPLTLAIDYQCAPLL